MPQIRDLSCARRRSRVLRIKPRPMCPVHRCEMATTSTGETIRKFRCRVPGCEHTAKEVRSSAEIKYPE